MAKNCLRPESTSLNKIAKFEKLKNKNKKSKYKNWTTKLTSLRQKHQNLYGKIDTLVYKMNI